MKNDSNRADNLAKIRRSITTWVWFILPMIVAFLALVTATQTWDRLSSIPAVVGVIAGILGAASWLIIRYLQPESSAKARHRPVTDYEMEVIDNRLSDLTNNVEQLKLSEKNLTDEQKDGLFAMLRSRFADAQAKELLASIRDSVEKDIAKDVRSELVFRQFDRTLARLERETEALSKRGIVNLVLGMVATAVGFILLGLFIYWSGPNRDEPWMLLAYFIPRLTLVVLIEVFAYFFLGLYRTSLVEIKYFQNEMTNVEGRLVGVMVAMSSNDSESIKKVAAEMMSTERNFVLKRGESTVEIEKARIESQSLREVLKEACARLKKE